MLMLMLWPCDDDDGDDDDDDDDVQIQGGRCQKSKRRFYGLTVRVPPPLSVRYFRFLFLKLSYFDNHFHKIKFTTKY